MEEPIDGDEEDEEGSPLYCNWDLRGLQHLLPLQDYIIQQAKLSSKSHKRLCEDNKGYRTAMFLIEPYIM